MISEKRSSAVEQWIATKEVANKTNVSQILEYAGTEWDPHIQQDINKLKAVQRRAAHFVLRCFHNTLSVSEVEAVAFIGATTKDSLPLDAVQGSERLGLLGRHHKATSWTRPAVRPPPVPPAVPRNVHVLPAADNRTLE